MKKKLLGCALATLVTMAGSFYLASPAQAAALFGCPDGWQSMCGVPPQGCTVTAKCLTGPSGTPFVQCTVKC